VYIFGQEEAFIPSKKDENKASLSMTCFLVNSLSVKRPDSKGESMNSNPSKARILSILQSYVKTASVILVAVGIIVLIGWFFDIPVFKSILPNLGTMKFNTAVGFMLAGASLWLLRKESETHQKKPVGRVLASLILAIGLLTLSEYLFGRDLGIDQLVVKDLATPANEYPGRMPVATAIGLSLMGLALLRIGTRTAQYLSFGIAFLSYSAILIYLFDFHGLDQLPVFTSIALYTTTSFFILSLAVMAAQPSGEVTEFLTTDKPGTRMMRRSLPMTILLLTVLGWLVQKGEALGLYNVTSETVILIILMFIVYTPLLYFNARSINLAEQEIRLKDGLLEMTSKMAKVGGWEYDVETRRGTWTDEVARIHELDPQEDTNVDLGLSFYQSESREKIEKAVREANEDGKPYDLELEMITAKGSHKWVRTMALPILKDEKVVKVQGIFQDITARKQAEEKIQRQLKQLSALREIDQAITSSASIEVSLGVVINKMISLLSIDAATILLVDPADNSLYMAVAHGFRTYKIHRASVKINESYAGKAIREQRMVHIPNLENDPDNLFRFGLLKDEEFISYYGVPLVTKGKAVGVMEVFDRTLIERDQEWLNFLNTLAGQAAVAIDNGQLFESLQRSNIELEHRVEVRTAELNKVNAELEHANRAKDEFLANMSHELRTPLNSILGLSESLLEQRRDPLSQYQQKSLKIVESSGRHLLDLINDILDLSKIEAGKLDYYPEAVGIDEICQASLAFVKSQAMQKFINLIYEEDKTISRIHADPRRLKQILVNLLTNAVKFTPERGQVTLQVHGNAEQDLIRFSVVDTGAGIAPKDLERLFQPFTQVDSRLNRQQEGSGLGLVLVQRLTDLHGGSVHVKSEPDQGSNFSIVLPWRRELVIQPGTTPSIGEDSSREPVPSSELSRKQGAILLAEDNMANILTIGEYLENRGYDVRVAHNGLEAIQLVEETNPDIILMDVQMPAMDGLEATRRLRANPRFASTPIIALTALAMPGDRQRCLEAGANEYMSKPVSLKELVRTIDILMNQ
jgi:PAS domain S-box-containing protein